MIRTNQAEGVVMPPCNGNTAWPFVTVIIPVYNEERFIGTALDGVLAQDYPAAKLEIVIADGMSSDNTRQIIQRFMAAHPNIELILNPQRIVSTGLNRAIHAAKGEVIVRLDGHCEYPGDYVRRVVELRQQLGADNVGGVLVPVGTSYVQQAIAKAYYSPAGFFGAALKGAGGSEVIRQVDAVHGGCWRRDRLLAVGGFDEQFVRNQDDELSFRLRKNSGKIYQYLGIRVKYHVRNSFKKLLQQFFQYGYWKVSVIKKHPQQAGVRHFAAGLFVLTLVTLAISGLFTRAGALAFAILANAYIATIAATSFFQTRHEIRLWPGIIAALVLMHVGYGFGFLTGCICNFLNLKSNYRLVATPTR